MKKPLLLFVCACVLVVATPAFAQQPSVTFMPLASSTQFLNRVQFNIVQTAPLIEVEAQAYTPAGGDTHPSTAACHTLRAKLAASVAGNPTSYQAVFAAHLIVNSAVTSAGPLTGAGVTLDTPATDGALFSAIAAIWSTVAGCVTVP